MKFKNSWIKHLTNEIWEWTAKPLLKHNGLKGKFCRKGKSNLVLKVRGRAQCQKQYWVEYKANKEPRTWKIVKTRELIKLKKNCYLLREIQQPNVLEKPDKHNWIKEETIKINNEKLYIIAHI